MKYIIQPYSVLAITLCDPGASIPECKPIVGPNNTVILQIENDLAPPKVEFPLTQLDVNQSSKKFDVTVRRVGYLHCDVTCDWFTDSNHKGKVHKYDKLETVRKQGWAFGPPGLAQFPSARIGLARF